MLRNTSSRRGRHSEILLLREQNISMLREILKMSEIGNIVRPFPCLAEYVVTPAGTWFWTDGLSVSKPCPETWTTDRFNLEKKFNWSWFAKTGISQFNMNSIAPETTAPSTVSDRNQSENNLENELILQTCACDTSNMRTDRRKEQCLGSPSCGLPHQFHKFWRWSGLHDKT